MKTNDDEPSKYEQGEREFIQAMSKGKASETTINLDELKPIVHRWVDRGLVMSCEGAGHPNHRSFKIR